MRNEPTIMNRSGVLFGFCTIVIVLLASCEAQECAGGPHDRIRPCGDPCPNTCENPGPKPCPAVCLPNSCACEDGYYRRSDGRCVTLDQCKPNLHYIPADNGYTYPPPPPTPKVCTGGPHDLVKNCVSLCPATCEHPEPRSCATKCKENAYCECEKGYYRNSDGRCVTLDQCPPKRDYIPSDNGHTPLPPTPKVCTGGPHDLVKNCVSLCPATCEHPEPRSCATKCKENAYCECEKGYYRRSDGRCVTLDQCPPKLHYIPSNNGHTPLPPTPKVCTGGPHDLVKNCVSLCPATCEHPEPRSCATKCKENAYCECEKGYYRRSDGRCVTLDQCPPKPNAPSDEGYTYPPPPPKPKVCTGGPHDLVKNCVSLCPATCEHPEPRSCATKCKENAYCECDKGYYRRSDGRCVTLNQCPQKPNAPSDDGYTYRPPTPKPKVCTGGPHDVVTCASPCPATCENPGPNPCTKICIPNTCECEPGYYRRSDGRCVTYDQCNRKPDLHYIPSEKPVCTGGPHDNVQFCSSACPATCESPVSKPCSQLCAGRACECDSGYYRRNDGLCVTLDQCKPRHVPTGYYY